MTAGERARTRVDRASGRRTADRPAPHAGSLPNHRGVPVTDQQIRTVVAETVADVLAVDSASVAAVPNLRDVPTYNSFRIVEIIERLEEHLDIEMAPDDLTPGNLGSVDSLTALCERSMLASAGSGHE